MEASAGRRDRTPRLSRWVPGALLGLGAASMAVGVVVGNAAAQSPTSVVAALEASTPTSITFTVVPAFSAGSGAWVSIMNPNTGAVYVHSQISQTLTAGHGTKISVPVTLPADQRILTFSSFLEIPGGATQSVVLAAETTPTTPPPVFNTPPPSSFTPSKPPIATTPHVTHPSSSSSPPIPAVPPTSSTSTSPHGGSSAHTVTLPKTGAGPFLELAGVVLLLAGGLLLVLRPKPQ
jgi:hypothetical protein